MKLITRVFAIALCFLASLSGAALAHAHLTASVPPAGASLIKAPAELELTFSEGIDLAFTGVTISGPAVIALGKPSLKAGGDTTLVVPLLTKLSAGTYTVSWHALSSDGHKSKGSFEFAVAP